MRRPLGYSSLVTNLLASGDRLEDVQREAEHGLKFAQKARLGMSIDIITGQRPENFENHAALVGAEIARIEGRELLLSGKRESLEIANHRKKKSAECPECTESFVE
jgi:hypothetical protein